MGPGLSRLYSWHDAAIYNPLQNFSTQCGVPDRVASIEQSPPNLSRVRKHFHALLKTDKGFTRAAFARGLDCD
jgi:hypothetical protein